MGADDDQFVEVVEVVGVAEGRTGVGDVETT